VGEGNHGIHAPYHAGRFSWKVSAGSLGARQAKREQRGIPLKALLLALLTAMALVVSSTTVASAMSYRLAEEARIADIATIGI
jgi:predicted lysophospholipase L1 biosynthesis ABC-type transport system permease subunit